ncbi:MAG: helix-turn-helix transcriptional regulator [Clostridia bacterium]|nr:helix-turn-helix transcriptional regulator [Clostridia bacterium]
MAGLALGEIIKTKRKERDLTQEEVAEAMGVSKAAVSKWENCDSYPDVTLLPQIAEFFEITIDELFGYSPKGKPPKIVNKYIFGLSLDAIEDRSIFDYSAVAKCEFVKSERREGKEIKSGWEVRVELHSTEEDFPQKLQKCLKPGELIDGMAYRYLNGRIVEDDKPNKYYVCREKIWEYRIPSHKYVRQMLKEQVEMGLIEDNGEEE